MGAGDALGGAIARRFAREGFDAVIARRNADKLKPLESRIRAEGGRAHAFGCDARDEAQLADLFGRVERDIGPVEIAVFNVGANVRFGITETTTRVFTKVWQMACLGGFLTGRAAAQYMLTRGRGTVIFTGATASLRGSNGFAAFASAKHGLRAVAQSMARELGPQGIHVAHVVIDGPIDTAFIRENFPDMVAARPADGLLSPDDIAETYWALHCQKRSAWTHEADLRPWLEPW